MIAIEIIKKSIKTHEDWLAFFMEHPEEQTNEEYKRLGDSFFHEKCISDFEKVIKKLQSLEAENKELKICQALNCKNRNHEYAGVCLRCWTEKVKKCQALQSELDKAKEEKHVDIEKISEAVHIAYCEQYKLKHGKEYWTKGNYGLLDEETKEFDRATVKAVLQALASEEVKNRSGFKMGKEWHGCD